MPGKTGHGRDGLSLAASRRQVLARSLARHLSSHRLSRPRHDTARRPLVVDPGWPLGRGRVLAGPQRTPKPRAGTSLETRHCPNRDRFIPSGPGHCPTKFPDGPTDCKSTAVESGSGLMGAGVGCRIVGRSPVGALTFADASDRRQAALFGCDGLHFQHDGHGGTELAFELPDLRTFSRSRRVLAFSLASCSSIWWNSLLRGARVVASSSHSARRAFAR